MAMVSPKSEKLAPSGDQAVSNTASKRRPAPRDTTSSRGIATPPAAASVYTGIKRGLDCTLAALFLLLCAPFLALFVAAIRLTSRGPAIYRQTRLGLNDEPFVLYKLRTMPHECERLTGPCWAVPNDPRATAVGRFLRAFHLDELPQLWNVARGDMSLIGPRPERPEIITRLERQIPSYAQRRQVRPGITGLAQLQLPPDTSVACVRRKLVYDLYYVQQLSPWLDVRIFFGTFLKLAGIPYRVLHSIGTVPHSISGDVPAQRASF